MERIVKKSSQVTVRRRQGNVASPVVSYPTATVGAVRRPTQVVAARTVTKPTVRGNTTSVKRGVTDKLKK